MKKKICFVISGFCILVLVMCKIGGQLNKSKLKSTDIGNTYWNMSKNEIEEQKKKCEYIWSREDEVIVYEEDLGYASCIHYYFVNDRLSRIKVDYEIEVSDEWRNLYQKLYSRYGVNFSEARNSKEGTAKVKKWSDANTEYECKVSLDENSAGLSLKKLSV